MAEKAVVGIGVDGRAIQGDMRKIATSIGDSLNGINKQQLAAYNKAVADTNSAMKKAFSGGGAQSLEQLFRDKGKAAGNGFVGTFFGVLASSKVIKGFDKWASNLGGTIADIKKNADDTRMRAVGNSAQRVQRLMQENSFVRNISGMANVQRNGGQAIGYMLARGDGNLDTLQHMAGKFSTSSIVAGRQSYMKELLDAEKIRRSTDRKVALSNLWEGAKVEGVTMGSKGLTSILSSIGPITIALAAVGGALVVFGKQLWDFSKTAVAAFRDFNSASKALERTLKANGFGASSGALNAQAQALSRGAGISAGDTMQAQAFLTRSGYSPEQVQELIRLAASIVSDPSTNVKSLEDASKKLADAFNGQIDSLKEIGIKANSVADAAAKLRANFGGARTVSQSSALEQTWNRIYVIFGKQIAPIWDGMISFFNDVLTGFEVKDASAAAKELGYWWGVISDVTKFTVMYISDQFSQLTNTYKVLERIVALFALIPQVIQDIITGDGSFTSAIKSLKQGFKDVQDAVGEGILGAIGTNGPSYAEIGNTARARAAAQSNVGNPDVNLQGRDAKVTETQRVRTNREPAQIRMQVVSPHSRYNVRDMGYAS